MEFLRPLFDQAAGYPPWLVVGCGAIVLAAMLYVLAKIVKWSLYLLVALVLICGLGASLWLLLGA